MSVFEPDILNDAGTPWGRGGVMVGERRLMAAILTDALECFQKNLARRVPKQRRLFRDAEQWIQSDERQWVFSFRNICDVLGIDAHALRAKTAAWKHAHVAERERASTPSQVPI